MLTSPCLRKILFSAITALGLVLPVTNATFTYTAPVAPLMVEEVPCEEKISEALIVEETLARFEDKFRCTIYYTPKQTGFTAEGGFNVTAETRTGLKRRMFPRDFLLAVEKEGYGRLRDQVNGHSYISYFRGAWKFADAPLDCSGKPLIARRSCAVKSGHKLIRPQTKLRVCGSRLPQEFDELRWIVTDTGSGLSDGQIDLYWGEEDPSGPGKGITLPKGGRTTIDHATILVLR